MPPAKLTQPFALAYLDLYGSAMQGTRPTLALTRFLRLALLFVHSAVLADVPDWTHALALYGEPKYEAGFSHFDYVNPQAPKGGRIRLAVVGSFDSLNPFVLKGVAAAGSLSLLYNRLCSKSQDESHTVYGQLAQSVRMPEDRSWISFRLHPDARWHDGVPVTAADVEFSFWILVEEGIPFFRHFYADVEAVEIVGPKQVTFHLKEGVNREMPLILGQLRVLPKHYWQGRDFSATTLDPPLGSGPYRIAALEPGRSITYERVRDYWGAEQPVHRGLHNFDRIQYAYYRDATVAVEAFKTGGYDIRLGSAPLEWATAYGDLAPVAAGQMIVEAVPHQLISGMQGFCFNSRRAMFADRRVRWALAHAYDFEWTNRNLFYDLFSRCRSYWGNSVMAASGLPSGLELELLSPYRDRIPEEVFDRIYEPPITAAPNGLRQNLRLARNLLATAGWRVVDGQLTSETTGEVMRIEFLLSSPSFERVLGLLIQNLERLGVQATIRTVDGAQYQQRLQEYDYDVVAAHWRQTLTPGNEQRNFWSSAAADAPGSRNYAGIRDSVINELIERQIAAPDRATQIAVTRALDRLLIWGHYVIPDSYSQTHRLVYWDKFGKPEQPPPNALGFPETWWWDEARASRLIN